MSNLAPVLVKQQKESAGSPWQQNLEAFSVCYVEVERQKVVVEEREMQKQPKTNKYIYVSKH